MNRPVAIYRHYDRDQKLLYVGITDDMTRRSREHSKAAEWWSLVDDTRVQYVQTRAHALDLERVAIIHEKPAHNVALSGLSQLSNVTTKCASENSDLIADLEAYRDRHRLTDTKVGDVVMASLSQFLAEERITVRAFAAKAEISPSFLSELTAKNETRRKSPSLEVALRIQRASKGRVAVADWPELKAIADAVHDFKPDDPASPVQGDVAQASHSGGAA
ncbi:MAG TPA: hypothetical protein DCX29_01735 [Hyphomonas sp.]|jgi:predicted GIY-YIG superfamily endonuclease|nr:hypothetical protein [Hyphomonas sp.]